MQTAVLNVEDVEVALLERQFDPGTTLPMAFGDGDGGLGYVVGDADMAAGGPPRLASGGQVLKAAHRRAPGDDLGKGDLLPQLPSAMLSPGLAQRDPGPVVERADRAGAADDLEFPITARDRPGLDAVGKAQLVGSLRVGGNVVALDDEVTGQKFAAHRFDRRVADEVGDGVDRVDMTVHQTRVGVVDHRFDFADPAFFYGLFNDVVAIVETAQDAGI